ncbi:SH3 domain-containing protein [Rhizobium sp. PP-CC-3G-465]|nr:SH3 domain-containing protein [Rhizobium sp. PP-CC-3G-465]
MIGVIAGLASAGPGFVICALAIPGFAIGKWFDSYRRSSVLFYDLEDDGEAAYKRLVDGFDGFINCAAKWHIEAGGAIQNLTAWKRNAGASHLVNRKPTTLAYRLPSVIKSNITPPALHVGKQVMYFMPDVVLVQDGNRFGAVGYQDLRLRWQDSRFIETERVPSDARVVDHTWKHPNKSGGPDRRFRDNRQIPICLYEALHIQSDTGINELVEFSRTGLAASFVEGCRSLAGLPRERSVTLPLPAGNEAADTPLRPAPTIKRHPLRTAAFIVLGIAMGIPIVAGIVGSRTTSRTSSALVDVPAADKAATSASSSPPNSGISPLDQSPFAEGAETSHTITDAPRNGEPTSNKAQGAMVTQEPRGAKDSGPTIISQSVETLGEVQQYTKVSVNLRAGPGTTHSVISVIPKGKAVVVVEVRGGWSRVRVEDTKNGWMANSTISSESP